MLGLRFRARAFSSCGEWGPLFITVCWPLTVAASLVAKHRLQTRRLSSCGSRAQLLCSMWDLPRPRLEPVSPALAGRFSTTAPPGKPLIFLIVSFDAQKFLLLMKCNLFFPFVAYAFGVIFKKPCPKSSRFSSMFPSKSFIVLALTFSFDPFLAIFWSKLIILRVDTQLSKHQLLKKLYFPC